MFCPNEFVYFGHFTQMELCKMSGPVVFKSNYKVFNNTFNNTYIKACPRGNLKVERLVLLLLLPICNTIWISIVICHLR